MSGTREAGLMRYSKHVSRKVHVDFHPGRGAVGKGSSVMMEPPETPGFWGRDTVGGDEYLDVSGKKGWEKDYLIQNLYRMSTENDVSTHKNSLPGTTVWLT